MKKIINKTKNKNLCLVLLVTSDAQPNVVIGCETDSGRSLFPFTFRYQYSGTSTNGNTRI